MLVTTNLVIVIHARQVKITPIPWIERMFILFPVVVFLLIISLQAFRTHWPYVYPTGNWWSILILASVFGAGALVTRYQFQVSVDQIDVHLQKLDAIGLIVESKAPRNR